MQEKLFTFFGARALTTTARIILHNKNARRCLTSESKEGKFNAASSDEMDTIADELEKNLEKASGSFDTFSKIFPKSLKEIFGRIQSAKDDVEETKKQINNLETEQLKNLKDGIEKNRSNIRSLQSRVGDLKAQLDELKDSITTNQSNIRSLQFTSKLQYYSIFFVGIILAFIVWFLNEKSTKLKKELDNSKKRYDELKTEMNEYPQKLDALSNKFHEESNKTLMKFKKDSENTLSEKTKKFEQVSKKFAEDSEKQIDKFNKRFEESMGVVTDIKKKLGEVVTTPPVLNEEILHLNEEIQRLQVKYNDSLSGSWFLSFMSWGYSHQLKMRALVAVEKDLQNSGKNSVNIQEILSLKTINLVKQAYPNHSLEEEDKKFRDTVLKKFLSFSGDNPTEVVNPNISGSAPKLT